jgi:hypothetical protein
MIRPEYWILNSLLVADFDLPNPALIRHLEFENLYHQKSFAVLSARGSNKQSPAFRPDPKRTIEKSSASEDNPFSKAQFL